MDPFGARLLAARIKAGVSVGTRIELVTDAPGLSAGDRGIVDEIDEWGHIHVVWDRGCTVEIDPDQTSFRSVAA